MPLAESVTPEAFEILVLDFDNLIKNCYLDAFRFASVLTLGYGFIKVTFDSLVFAAHC